VFDLFVQGEHSAGQHSGLGIGLALARRLIEMHGGSIDARSDGAGSGSTFTITVPRSKRMVEALAAHRDARHMRGRVLIVDDNQDAANSMAMLVEAVGGTAKTAYDAASGLNALGEFRPDVVVLDIGMPGIDGYEMCQRIRLRPADRHIVVIALTGWGHPQDKQRALDAGFDAHLTKPVDPAAFQELLAVSRTGERQTA
jgi:CheY-like chemotaxis protein